MSIEEEFLKKLIQVQTQLHYISSQSEFEDSFVSNEKTAYISNLKSTKKYLKTYYLRQFSIIQTIFKNDESAVEETTKKLNFLSFLTKKDKNKSDETNKFEFKLIECSTISKYEKNVYSEDNFNSFVKTLTSIERDQNYLNLITFSVLPSYYNFFLTKDDIENFIKFLKEVYKYEEKIYFITYSKIIYYTPLFLNFCHHIIFNGIIIEYLHNTEHFSLYSTDRFFNFIISSININKQFCPPLFKHFLEEFSEFDNFSLSEHIETNFFLPLFNCPIQFSAIREFDFLPENFFSLIKINGNNNNINDDKDNSNENIHNNNNDDNDVNDNNVNDNNGINDKNTKKCKKNHINRFIEVIKKIETNNKLLITEKKSKCQRVFSSFDIDIIERKTEIDRIDFTNYSYVFCCEEETKKNISEMEGSHIQEIQIFKELLKLADTLPSIIKPPNDTESLLLIMEEFLVNNGDFNTQLERQMYFQQFKNCIRKDKNFLNMLISEMKDESFINNKSFDKNARKLDKVIKQKQSWIAFTSLIAPYMIHVTKTLNMLNSMVYKDKTIISYTKEEISKIVKSPRIIIEDYEKYKQCKVSPTNPTSLTTLTADEEVFYYYYKKLSNLRFSDFLSAHENVLEQYDSLINSFIECNHEIMISYILQPSSDNSLKNMVKYNSYLFDSFIDEIRSIFEINGSAFEKQRDLANLLFKCTTFLGPKDLETYLNFIQIIILKSNPKRFLSNFIYLENFYFKFVPDVNNNTALRNIFYSVFNYVFPMKKTKLFTSIIPFIIKNVTTVFHSNIETYALHNKRLLIASNLDNNPTYFTYLVTITYSKNLPNTKDIEMLIVMDDKLINNDKNVKVPIKIAITDNKNIVNSLTSKYNAFIDLHDPNTDFEEEVKKCILRKYEGAT